MRLGLPATSQVPALSGLRTLPGRMLVAATVLSLVALAAALGAAASARLLGYGTLVVHGGSMGDSIPNGSLAIARWVADEDVRVGDVILVRERSDESLPPKIHRVVWLERDGSQVLARTKGDANATEDPVLYVLPQRVLAPGYHIPYLGFLVAFVSTPLGWTLLVAIPGALLCLAALRSIWFPATQPARESVLTT